LPYDHQFALKMKRLNLGCYTLQLIRLKSKRYKNSLSLFYLGIRCSAIATLSSNGHIFASQTKWSQET